MSTEIEIFAGRRFLGLVRERHDGSFIAVVAEQVIGPFRRPGAPRTRCLTSYGLGQAMIDAPINGARRIAVSPEQIAEHDLLTKPRRATDRPSLESVQTPRQRRSA